MATKKKTATKKVKTELNLEPTNVEECIALHRAAEPRGADLRIKKASQAMLEPLTKDERRAFVVLVLHGRTMETATKVLAATEDELDKLVASAKKKLGG